MFEWSIVNSNKINRVGYNKYKESMYVDFVGSDTDTVFLKVPEALYTTFIEAKSSDQFYDQFVEGYFDIASCHAVITKENYREKPRLVE